MRNWLELPSWIHAWVLLLVGVWNLTVFGFIRWCVFWSSFEPSSPTLLFKLRNWLLAGPLGLDYIHDQVMREVRSTLIRLPRRFFERSDSAGALSAQETSWLAQEPLKRHTSVPPNALVRPFEKCASKTDPARLQRRCSVVVGPSEVESHSDEAGAASS